MFDIGYDDFERQSRIDDLLASRRKKESDSQRSHQQYELNKDSEPGSLIPCPVCEEPFFKTAVHSAFCKRPRPGKKTGCREIFHNLLQAKKHPNGYYKKRLDSEARFYS